MTELAAVMQQLEEAIASVRGINGVLQPPTEQFTETDEDRIVTVSVDADGNFTQIKVASGWEDRLEPEMLQSRINEVIVRAVVHRLGLNPDMTQDEADALVEQIGLPSQVQQKDRDMAEQMVFEQSRDFEQLVEQVGADSGRALEELYKNLDRLDAALSSQDTPTQEQRYYSKNRMVSVLSNGQDIREVSFKENWLDIPRSGTTITICFNEILEQLPQTGSGSGWDDTLSHFIG